MCLRHFEGRPADAAADIEDALAVRGDAVKKIGHVAGSSRRHITLPPDQLEHRDEIFVVFVLVSHSSYVLGTTGPQLWPRLCGHYDSLTG